MNACFPLFSGPFSAAKPSAFLPVLFACTLLAPPCPAADQVSGHEGFQIIAERPFGNKIPFDAAARAAKAAARQEAMRAVARRLVARPDVQFIGQAGPSSIPRDPLALAYATTGLRASDAQTPDSPLPGRARTCVNVSLPRDQDLRRVLLHPDVLELYTLAATKETSLLEEYDRIASSLLDSEEPGGQKEAGDGAAAYSNRLAALAGALQGLDLYLDLLPSFFGTWQDPQKTGDAMQRILSLDQNNALAANAYGECLLLLNRPQEALEAQNTALRLDPDFARAFHARGVANLALGLPALAVADFNEAIRLAPHTAMYRRDRAAAWLVRQESGPMCRDFHDACALGDCGGYQWALAQDKCPGDVTTSP